MSANAITFGRGPGLRRRLRQLGRCAVGRLGCGLSRLLGRCAGDGFGILTYHRVTPWGGRGLAPTWNVPPRRFRAQLRGLLARNYRPLPLREILDRRWAGRPLPPRTFAVTFDDGFENLYTHARPVLGELGVPATAFLATAFLDGAGPFPFDDWPLAGSPQVPPDSWRPLTTAQCREMVADGLVELGCHTHTHALFRGRPGPFRTDLDASLAVLRDRFGIDGATFSFPFGIYDAELTAAARQAGLCCGLTTQNDLARPGGDPFAWGRFSVDESDTAATLAAKLDGWYSLARGAWLRWRGRAAEGSR